MSIPHIPVHVILSYSLHPSPFFTPHPTFSPLTPPMLSMITVPFPFSLLPFFILPSWPLSPPQPRPTPSSLVILDWPHILFFLASHSSLSLSFLCSLSTVSPKLPHSILIHAYLYFLSLSLSLSFPFHILIPLLSQIHPHNLGYPLHIYPFL